MRNLQKILALALALIMSFSLVATAGAFSDDGDISDSYKTAVNVLNGLEVFKGYDNGATFQPKGNITRAEVAAIIYRIATGDVTDSQASIYSTYGQFTDVADGSWYAGYVNYCANAGYIKGRGNKIFDPQGQVTGYEALAMILRAVGYDKNGEFTGSNWQIRTASIANQRGITKNVTEGMLGQAATRETVAEILFRAILVNQVDFSANTLSYTEKATSLGYDSLKLEEIEGVITANEYADLNEDDTLPDGRTEMLVDGKDYTIDYTTTLDDIGESHIAYIQNGKKVLAINDREEGNATAESTAKIKDEDALKAFAKENSISLNDSAERYINFSKGYRWMSDWRIRYEINFVSDSTDVTERTGAAWREYEGDRSDYGWTVELKDFQKAAVPFTDANGTHYRWTYSAEFKANEEINSKHQENIKAIFDHADRFNRVEDNRDGYSYGEVYAGTSSLKDLSDSMSYKQFVTEYINQDTEAKVEANEKGNWVKVIDNDKDGVAEYVLKVVYTTAQVSKVSDSSYTLDTKDIKLTDGDEINELESEKVVTADTLAVDDVVYYALIDGKAQTYKAEPVTAKIDKINRNDLTATTADGTVYEEAGVHEHIYNPDYVKPVTEMAGGVSYDMFLGRGGYLLAFVKSAAKSFTLLVDGYYNSSSKGDQYAVKAYQDGRIVNVDLNRNGGMFIDKNANGVLNNGWNAMRELGQSANWLNAKGNALKTTVAGLDEDGNLIPVDFGSVYERGSHAMIAFPKNAVSSTQEKYYTSIVEDAYTTGTAYVTGNSSVAYNALANTNDVNNRVEVRALSSTIYYFVWESKNDIRVQQYVGYGDLPNLSTEEMKKIEDIYAVGTQRDRVSTSADRTSTYYTADVVVVEFAEPYTEFAERILLVDTPVVSAGIQIDEVEVIRGNGAKETLRIDLTDSKIRNYNIAGKKGAQPGIYNLYPTNEEDLYTIESLTADEVAKTGVFSVGNVSTERYTADTNYLEVNTLAYGTERDFNGADYKQYKLTADTKYYTLNYNNKWDATLTESSLNTVLAPRVNESDRVFKNGDFFHDLDRVFPEQKLYGCYNNILVGGNTDNDTAVYVVSFENYDEDMYNNGDGGHVHYADYAQTVWQSLIPSIVAGKTEAPAVELRSGVNGTETVKVLSANATTTITFAEWVKFANQADLLYVTPQPNHTIAISGLTTFTDKSIPVDTMERVIPAVSITEDVPGTIRVLTQVSGGITETFTYDYILKAPNHESALPAAQLPLSKDSVLLNGQRYVNLEAFVLAFGVPSGATATWTFESERGETFTIVTKDGKVVTNNAPADIDILSEVKDNFSVVITAECGGEGAVNHTSSYDSTVIPKDPAKYNAAKAAYEAALPLDQADEAALNAAKTAIEAALAADNAANLEDGQQAELEGWLAEVNAALEGGEEPATSVNVTLRWKLNDKSNNYSELELGTLGNLGSVDIVNGQITIDSIDATPQGGTYFVYALNGMTAANEELEGEADFATGNWTVAIPEGTEEVLLTVHVIEGEFDPTLQLRADAPFAFNAAARAVIARAGNDGEETTEYYFVTLRNGQEPAGITNVKPEGAATFVEAKKWLPGKEGYTIWRVTITYDADLLGGDLNNLNFAVTGKNEGEEPGTVTVTVTLDGAAVEMTKNEDGTYTGTLTIPEGKKLTATSGENWTVDENNVITVSNVTESVTIALTTEDVVEDNAPVITLKLVDAKGDAVDAADATLVEVSHKENISGGKTTYNYEFKLEVLNKIKYAYGTSEIKDAAGKAIAGVAVNDDDTAEKGIIKVTGIKATDVATLTVKLADGNPAKVSVSDELVLSVSPSVLERNIKMDGVILQLALKDGMADQGYGFPSPIEVTMGGNPLVFGTDYVYDRAAGTITLKGDAEDKITGDIVIVSSASLEGSVKVVLGEANGILTGHYISVSPMSLKQGAAFSDGATISIFPKEHNAYPYATGFTLKMMSVANTPIDLALDTDYTYDEETGVITLKGDKTIVGNITIQIVAEGIGTLIQELNVSAKGAVESTVEKDSQQYMLVDPAKDDTLFKVVAAEIESWCKKPACALNDLVALNPNFNNFKTGPYAPSAEDNGSYLVVVYLKSGKVVAAGGTLLDGIQGSTSAEVEMVGGNENAHLTPELENGVITLTPDTDEEWLVPENIGGITVGGVALDDNEYSYDKETGKITLNTDKTGKIMITATAEKVIGTLVVKTSGKGVVTVTNDGDPVSTTSDDKIVLLNSRDYVESILPALRNNLGVSDFLDKLGITGATELAGNVALTDKVTADSRFVLFMQVVDEKVVAAGVGENITYGPAPKLSGGTVFGSNGKSITIGGDSTDSLSGIAATSNSLALASLGTTALTDGLAFTVDESDGHPASKWEAVFIATNAGVTPDDWNTLTEDAEVLTESSDTETVMGALCITVTNDSSGAISKIEATEPGTLYVKVVDNTNENNVSYYAIEVTVA